MERTLPCTWVGVFTVVIFIAYLTIIQPSRLTIPSGSTRGAPGRVVAVCCEFCGGLTDRILGLSTASEIADLTGRSLVVDQSIFHKRKAGVCKTNGSNRLYRSVDHKVDMKAVHAMNDVKDILFESNMVASDEYVKSHGYDFALELGAAIAREHIPCRERAIAYANSLSHRFVSGYNVLHVRTGGSNITIGGQVLNAVPWEDGHISELPDTLIKYAEKIPNDCICSTPLVILSDSTRLVSEMQIALNGKILVFTQGSQPVHVDRPEIGITESCDQAIFDLAVMSLAREIIGTHGRFGLLGSVLFADKSVPFRKIDSADEVMNIVLRLSECSCV